MATKLDKCEFCGLTAITRGHHVIPRSKGGTTVVPTCETCESYIHKRWSHNELRDTFNTVAAVLADEGFKRFLKWRLKQPATTLFKSERARGRDRNPYH